MKTLPKQQIITKTSQDLRFIMSPRMKQAFIILQMPILELKAWLEVQIEKNPLLEIIPSSFGDMTDDIYRKFTKGNFPLLSTRLPYCYENFSQKPSLFEFLMKQASQVFSSNELKIAESIIGNIDRKGYLAASLKELSISTKERENKIKQILKVIQTFEPIGIAARNLQESLLLQLKELKKENCLSYLIVKDHFNLLLNNKLPLLQKKLKKSILEIKKSIETDLVKLTFYPALSFGYENTSFLICDIKINIKNKKYKIWINDKFLPSFKFNSHYLKELNSKDKKQKISSTNI